jgi:hypothetical protein
MKKILCTVLIVVSWLFSLEATTVINKTKLFLENLSKIDGLPPNGICIITVSRRETKPGHYIYDVTKQEEIKRIIFKLRELCANNRTLIIFNETFFSKDIALSNTEKENLLQQMCQLSLEYNGLYLWINLLYFENNHAIDIDQINARISKGNTEEYFITTTGEPLMFPPLKSPDNTFIYNSSFGVFSGNVVTRYDKATYQGEEDNLLKKGYNYIPGEGKDISMNSETPFGNILIDNISTEVCFDLANSVRSKNKWSNNLTSQSNIHILQSNTISPYEYWACLPENELIIQADSQKNPIKPGSAFLTRTASYVFERYGNVMIKSAKTAIDPEGYLYCTTNTSEFVEDNRTTEKSMLLSEGDGFITNIKNIVKKIEIIPIDVGPDTKYTIIKHDISI